MTQSNDKYYLVISHTPSSRDNMFLGHAGVRLMREHGDEKTVHQIDFASAIRPDYGYLADTKDIVEVANHINISSLIIASAAALPGIAAVANSNLLEAFGAAAIGIFGGIMYAGHKKKPGILRVRERAEENYACDYYKIPITPENYESNLKRAIDNAGGQEFALWSENCATFALDAINSIKDITLPETRQRVMMALDITTPHDVHYIVNALRGYKINGEYAVESVEHVTPSHS